jgi:hypothetical protein
MVFVGALLAAPCFSANSQSKPHQATPRNDPSRRSRHEHHSHSRLHPNFRYANVEMEAVGRAARI